jgi:hypothetical protein
MEPPKRLVILNTSGAARNVTGAATLRAMQ